MKPASGRPTALVMISQDMLEGNVVVSPTLCSIWKTEMGVPHSSTPETANEGTVENIRPPTKPTRLVGPFDWDT